MDIAEKFLRQKKDFDDVYNAGYEKGRAEGGGDSYYDTFWDNFQDYGNRVEYRYAFSVQGTSNLGKYWTEDNFIPKYSMRPINASMMFRGAGQIDLVKQFAINNVTLDFSVCKTMDYCFGYSNITRIGKIELNVAPSISNMCVGCKHLHTIEELAVKENTITGSSSTFSNCTVLQNITVSGVIDFNFDIQYSPLTVASMKSIISHLKNFAGTDKQDTYTLSFSSKCWEALEASASPYEDGLTDNAEMSWEDYIVSLGWLKG